MIVEISHYYGPELAWFSQDTGVTRWEKGEGEAVAWLWPSFKYRLS